MATRSIWEGSVSFGLVNISVYLQSFEKSHDIKFNLLDKRDHSPIGYTRVNKNTGEEVDWDQIVKGYEYEDGRYVIMSSKDFEKANPRATQTIDIFAFVKMDEISPIYFEKPYFLAPQKRSKKSYVLLRDALRESKKVGLAKVVIRTKEHLAAVVPYEEGLVLEILRFAHELKAADEISMPEESPKELHVSKKEVEMAKQLIDGMSGKWEPQTYKDEYYNDLMNLIDKRIDEGATEKSPYEAEHVEKVRATPNADIMALLKKSLQSHSREESGSESPRRSRKSRASTPHPRHRKKAA